MTTHLQLSLCKQGNMAQISLMPTPIFRIHFWAYSTKFKPTKVWFAHHLHLSLCPITTWPFTAWDCLTFKAPITLASFHPVPQGHQACFCLGLLQFIKQRPPKKNKPLVASLQRWKDSKTHLFHSQEDLWKQIRSHLKFYNFKTNLQHSCFSLFQRSKWKNIHWPKPF